jgi:predicted DNA-binding protein YlxM (UPF0122 family)
MSKISIGLVLAELIKENNLSAIHIAERIGKSRQNIYNDLKKVAMKDEQIQEYAKALNIEKQVIYDRWNGKSTSNKAGDDLLAQQMESLEQYFKNQVEFQRQQIESQLRTIESQQRTIELLLGKSEGVSSNMPGSNSLILPSMMYEFGYTRALS